METYYVPPIILNWKTDWDYNFFIPEFEEKTDILTAQFTDYFKYRSEKIEKTFNGKFIQSGVRDTFVIFDKEENVVFFLLSVEK